MNLSEYLIESIGSKRSGKYFLEDFNLDTPMRELARMLVMSGIPDVGTIDQAWDMNQSPCFAIGGTNLLRVNLGNWRGHYEFIFSNGPENGLTAINRIQPRTRRPGDIEQKYYFSNKKKDRIDLRIQEFKDYMSIL